MRHLDLTQIVKLVTLARHDKPIGLRSALHDGDCVPADLAGTRRQLGQTTRLEGCIAGWKLASSRF
jgi:hypothetical protein